MKRKTKRMIGFIISPPIAVLSFMWFFYDIAKGSNQLWGGSRFIDIDEVVFLAAIFSSYMFTFLLLVPSIRFLKKKRKFSMPWVIVSGFSCGIIAFTGMDVLKFNEITRNPELVLISGLCAAFAAFVYCLIAGVKRF